MQLEIDATGRRRSDRPRVAPGMALLLLLAAQGQLARAHDIWLHADRFRLDVGDTLVVRQLVGAELERETSEAEGTTELPILTDMTPRFELLTAAGTIDLLAELPDARARPEVKPVLSRQMDSAGPALVIMDHDVLYTGHTDAEFLDYLRHEGLDPDAYRPHMGADGFQDEGYVRTLKALVEVGARSEGDSGYGLFARVTGQVIELVLLQDPYALEPGDTLEVRVLLHGEPLPGCLVKAFSSDGLGPAAVQSVRADARGVARLALDRPGLWLVRTVHLAPCSEHSAVDCSDTEWASYWTAYSFALD